MSLLRKLGLRNGRSAPDAPEGACFVERRAQERRLLFQEADLVLGDFDRMRVVVANLSSRGAGIRYSSRAELPFRLKLIAPTLKLNCWARVVWQNDGAAGLEFQEPNSAQG
jgi:hypothetical protein